MSRRSERRNDRPRHRALWRRELCQSCNQPIIHAEEVGEGGRLRGTVLEPEPSDDSIIVRNRDGYMVRDPLHEMSGRRYRWHNCPVRNSTRLA